MRPSNPAYGPQRNPALSQRLGAGAPIALALALLWPAVAGAQNDPLIYLDTELVTQVWETVVTGSDTGESYTADREPVRGNPGGFRSMHFDLPAAAARVVPTEITATHKYYGGVYNAAFAGALGGLVVTIDSRETSDELGGVTLTHSFALFQDEEVFTVELADCCSADWNVHETTTRCLHPQDFENENLLQPDFSESGGEIFFGFRTEASNTAADGARSVDVGIDNFRVLTYDPTDPSCTGNPADLRIHVTDSDHEWGVDPVIPFEITVVNEGGPSAAIAVSNRVPDGTTFDVAESSDGWDCRSTGSAGTTCTFPLGELAGDGTETTTTFAVRVDEGVEPMFGIYEDVRLTSAGRKRLPEDFARGIECTFYAVETCNTHYRHSDFCCFYEMIAGDICALLDYYFPAGRSPVPTPDRPLFDGLLAYRVRDHVFADTRGGRRAVELFYEHNADMVATALADPNIVALALTALRAWEPILRALADEIGPFHPDFQPVGQYQIDTLDALLDAMRRVAGVDFGAVIDRERARLDVASWDALSARQLVAKLHRLSCPGSDAMLPCGALNGDCIVSATDALIALHIAVGRLPFDPASDNDGNGTTTATDALAILRVGVGKDPASMACGI